MTGNGVARSALAVLAVLALHATRVEAQVLPASDYQPRNDAGFMAIKRSFNASDLVTIPGINCVNEKACALTSAIWHKERFWVLGLENWCCAESRAVAETTYIHEWTVDGNFVKTHSVPLPVDATNALDPRPMAGGRPQPTFFKDTGPEVRDMATDEWRYEAGQGFVATGGEAVFIGTEEGIYVTRFNTAMTQWELWDRIERANGTATVAAGDFANPIRGPGLSELRVFGTQFNFQGEGYMGVAYDPHGNGGQGSFWVGADDTGGQFFDNNRVPRRLAVTGWLPVGDPRGFVDPTDPLTQRSFFQDHQTFPEVGFSLQNTKPILEIDLHGNVLTELHNGTLVTDPNDPLYTHWDPTGNGDSIMDPGEKDADPSNDGFLATGGEWSAGGLELDPLTGNLWVSSDMDQRIIEVSTVTGDATGFAFQPFRRMPNNQGGITGIPNGDPGTYASSWDLLVFSNDAGSFNQFFGDDDFFTVHRGHQYPGLNGLTEPRLLTSIAPTPPAERDSALVYKAGDEIRLLIDETGRGSAAPAKRPEAGFLPALMFLDFNAATGTDAATDFTPLGFPGILPEFRVHNPLSNPAVPFSLSVQLSTDSILTLPSPPIFTGQRFRAQALYFDSRSQYSTLGVMVTNEAWFLGVRENEVLVELVGEDSSRVHADGFFRIHYLGGPAIEVVKLDFQAAVSNVDLVDAWFDLDDPTELYGAMGVGRAWDGVSVEGAGIPILVDLPGCDSTFRQDSDITTGLVYAAQYVYPAPLDQNNPVPQYVPGSSVVTTFDWPICDYYTDELGYQLYSGFTATAGVFGGATFEDDVRDLVFQFTDFDDPGDVLRFDCDTDEVLPPTAEQHVGMVVTIIQAGRAPLIGELLPDPEGGRAFISW